MEQLEFDCRLESERELEENVNIALEFACKQVKETSKSKVSNRHDGYGIASEFYAGMKLDQKKVDESMKDFLRILPTEDDAKAVEAASSLKNAATGLVLQATKLAAQADRIMHDLYDEVSSYTTPVEDYLEGQFEDAEADPEAEAEEEKGNYVVEEEPGRFRRIIAAPMPIDIYEIDAVKALLDADQIVIAAGGGGIPVLQQGSHLKGASAIIEKDYTAAKLAELVGADTLLFLTAYDKLTIGKGTADEKVFDNVSAADLHQYIKAGHFPAKTTFPKVDASIRFVAADSDRKAVIANLEQAKEGLDGKAGTTITA